MSITSDGVVFEGMTPEEMLQLLTEYGSPLTLRAHVSDPEVYDGDCKYEFAYKGIIVGSELVPAWSVRETINKIFRVTP